MVSSTSPPYLSVWGWWFEAMMGVLRDQWKFLNAHYHISMDLLDALARNPGGAASGPAAEAGGRVPGPPAPAPSLEVMAAERMRCGLAPPREIHDVQNRARIDWSKFPDWARPTDPEVFGECSHEG